MNERSDHIALRTEKLVKVFRDFWRRPKARAVDGVDLEIRRGEIFGLLGPNGSGKSTTIKVLLGLLRPSSGTAEVLGFPPRAIAAKAMIGYLPEESRLYDYLTPRETLEFYGRLFDFDRRARAERIEQLLEMVGLSHAAHRCVGEFSKGMARRVGLAQALVNDPRLLILDEPTSGLDPIGRRQVKDLLLALAKRGKTILLSSHLLADVEDVCDRVAILYNGRIRAQGSISRLLERRDHVRFTVPALPPDAMKDLLARLRQAVGSEPWVDHPSRNLEQFFLEVVEQAHQAADVPSGAATTGKLADFLTENPE
ncbi:MAG: ABC transporter ATP-binding protein [Verrucomicrobiota bacterium]|nr:ABC transporter ATP-binding protein [Verrucomicrobiota bacterium]